MTEDRPYRSIVTVTLNPALDVSTSVPAVTPEHKLRCERAVREPGGGGINVSRVVSRLGADVTTLTVAGGATGQQVVSLLEAEGLPTVAIAVDAETRQSLAVSERSTERQFRFVLPGPPLPAETISAVRDSLRQTCAGLDDPLVVISGSIPPGTASGAMADLINSVSPGNVVVDTSGPALKEALQAPAYLVKPSVRELESFTGRSLETEAEVSRAASEAIVDTPVGALLVSIGAGGALLVRPNGRPVRLRAPTVRVRSAVGAGDSLVGGLCVGLARGHGLPQAAALGVAAGTATVMTEGSRLCTPAVVQELLPLVAIDPEGPAVQP